MGFKFAMKAAAAAAMCVSLISSSAMADKFSWSGFYFGGHVGGGWSDIKALDVLQPAGGFFTPVGPAAGQGFSFDGSGVIGGGQIGIQHQFNSIVIGAELSGTFGSLKEKIASPFFPASDTQSGQIGSIVAVTGKLGLAMDRLLPYVKAGYAGADIEFKASDNVANVRYNQSQWHNGFTVGAGLEYALTKSIIIGAEYNYYDFGSRTKQGLASDGGTERYKIDSEVHAITGRVNFLIGRGEDYHPMK